MGKKTGVPRRDLRVRFEQKIRVTPGCWEWLAYKTALGYGRIGLPGKASGADAAHRVAYRLYVGEIPAGLWGAAQVR